MNSSDLVLNENKYASGAYGFYKGIVIQNDDPDRRGRVKIFIPAFQPQIYDKWIGASDGGKQNFTVRFPGGNNVNSDPNLNVILEEVKKISLWADQASPLVGAGTAGLYNQQSDSATISDASFPTSRESESGTTPSANVDSIGEKAGHLFETRQFRLNDGFVTYNKDHTPEINPFAHQYRPSTYSNMTKGLFSVPNVGAHVWIFFENGNVTKPVYCAYSYDKTDWQSIYDQTMTPDGTSTDSGGQGTPGMDYPDGYENSDSPESPSLKRGKTVLNSKGATIEVIDTDGFEKIKISQAGGSFIEMNNMVRTDLVIGNEQKLIKGKQFETVEGTKNIRVYKNINMTVDGSIYRMAGKFNYDAYNKWKQIMDPISDAKARFAIKRAKKLSSSEDFIANQSQNQEQSGDYADNPILGLSAINVNGGIVSASAPVEEYDPETTIYDVTLEADKYPRVRAEENQVTDFTTVIPTVNPEGAEEFQPAPDVVEYPTAGTFRYSAGEFGSDNFTGDDVTKSASTKDGEWDEDPIYTKATDVEKQSSNKFLEAERQMGNGGDDISETTRDRTEVIGVIFNNAPAVRVDEAGVMDFNEVLIDDEGAFASQKESRLVERVSTDRKFPCGNYSLIVGNSFSTTVGSGGIDLKSSGHCEIGGADVVISGKEQAIVSSGGDCVINAGGRLLISADIITLRQAGNKQVGIDGSLGVKNNVIIGGSAYVDGELFVQHITAPLEVQATEQTVCFGRPVPDKKIGYVIGTDVFGVTDPDDPDAADSIELYPHSHHFKAIPTTFMTSNRDVRITAQNLNKGDVRVPAKRTEHGYKKGYVAPAREDEILLPEPIDPTIAQEPDAEYQRYLPLGLEESPLDLEIKELLA